MKAFILSAMLLSIGLLIGAGADRDATTIGEIKQAIGTLNEAFVKKDAAAIKSLMTEDHVAITSYYGGAATNEVQTKSLSEHKISQYMAGKTTVKLLTPDVAFVTYTLDQKGTYQGVPLPPKNYVLAVWVNRDGKWLEASYQETALP